VENARRAGTRLVEHVAVKNDAVDHFIALIQAESSAFEEDRLIAPGAGPGSAPNLSRRLPRVCLAGH